MIYVYDDYAGTHSTALAAAYHLKKLPTDRKLTKEEILNVDYFNQLTKDDFGKIFFMESMRMEIRFIQLAERGIN